MAISSAIFRQLDCWCVYRTDLEQIWQMEESDDACLLSLYWSDRSSIVVFSPIRKILFPIIPRSLLYQQKEHRVLVQDLGRYKVKGFLYLDMCVLIR